jgi:hypothetical protein
VESTRLPRVSIWILRVVLYASTAAYAAPAIITAPTPSTLTLATLGE